MNFAQLSRPERPRLYNGVATTCPCPNSPRSAMASTIAQGCCQDIHHPCLAAAFESADHGARMLPRHTLRGPTPPLKCLAAAFEWAQLGARMLYLAWPRLRNASCKAADTHPPNRGVGGTRALAHLFIYLFMYLFIHLIYLFIYLFNLFIRLFIYIYIYRERDRYRYIDK